MQLAAEVSRKSPVLSSRGQADHLWRKATKSSDVRRLARKLIRLLRVGSGNDIVVEEFFERLLRGELCGHESAGMQISRGLDESLVVPGGVFGGCLPWHAPQEPRGTF